MPDYDLGTATGKITAEYDGTGVEKAKRGFNSLGDSASKTSPKFKEAAGHATVAGGVIAAGLGIAAKTAMDFEKQISAIGAVSGATQSDLDALSKKALQIGADTSFSATQAASAMEELAKAGIGIPDIMNGAADATVALAAAGGVSLPEAATLAADAMNSFQLSAQDMPHIADLVAGAANASSIGVGEFGQSLKQVGAVAKLTGVSFEDTATAIALMGKMGIKGSDAGTSLKTMLMNLNPTTEKQKGLMEDLGIVTKDGANAFFDATGKAKSLADISQVLQDSMKGMTQQQKMAALETMFGSDAIRAAAVLSDQGAKGFDGLAASMGKVTAEQVASKRLDNTAGSLEQLKGSAETLAISMGMALLPAIKSIIDALTGLFNWFNGLSDNTKKMIVDFLGAVATILLLVGATYKIMQAAKAFMVVWRLLNLSFIATPIGMIILLIVALVAAFVILWNKSAAFRNFWIAIWNGIKAAAAAVADWFMNTIVPSLQKAWDQLKAAWSAVGAWFGKIWASLKTAFAQGKAVIAAVINGIVGWFRWWYNLGRSIGNAIVAANNAIIAKVRSILLSIGAVITRVVQFFSDMKNGVVSRMGALLSYVKGIPGRVSSALGNLGRLLYNKGRDLVSGFVDGIKSMIDRARNAASSLVHAVTDFLPGSPAKEGPLSGKGYVLLRAKRFGDDFTSGILAKVAAARDAAASLAGSVSAAVPVDNTAIVNQAMTNVATASVAPVVAPAAATASHAEARSIVIQRLELRGVWDFADPAASRKVVAKLHSELDRYQKGYQ